VFPNRLHEANRAEKRNENRDPPNGVTARYVSRRISRSSDKRAMISRGTGLSVAFDSISLLSQILGPNLPPNFGFPAKIVINSANILLGVNPMNFQKAVASARKSKSTPPGDDWP
jgi:hypothetical protein